MIKFHRFKAQNFLSFKKLEYEIPDIGLVYVGGQVGDSNRSNGAGKSAMWEVIPFALYGKTVRGVVGNEVIQHGQKSTKVEVEFSIGLDEYRVTRNRDGKGQTLDIFKNGGSIAGVDSKETQKIIEGELAMGFPLFVNSVIFGQGLSYRFIQAPDTEKKEIFEQLLSLGWIKEAHDNAKNFGKALSLDLDELSRKVVTIENKKMALEEEIERWQESDYDVERLENNISSKKREIATEEEKLEEILVEKNRLEEVKENLKNELGEQMQLDRNLIELGNAIGQEKQHGHSASTRILSKQEEMNTLSEAPCPTCYQPVPSEHVARISKALGEEYAIYHSAFKNAEEFSDAVSDFKSEIVGKLRLKDSEFERMRGEVRKAEEDVSTTRRHIAEGKASLEGIEHLLAKARQTQKKLEELRGNVVGLEEERVFAVDEVMKKRKEIEISEFWVDGFGNRGVKSLLLDSVVEWLNNVSAQFASKLSHGELVPVFSSTTTLKSGEERETFSVNVKKEGVEVDYKQISGGEKRRVDVVVLLSLYRLLSMWAGNEVNLLVFDEVFEALDSEGIEQVVNTLSEFRDEGKSVHVISHQEEAKSLFDDTLLVLRDERGVSSFF